MKLNFKKISLSDKKIFDRFSPYDELTLGWEYDFAMTFCWGSLFNSTSFADCGDMLIVKTVFHGTTVFYPPIVKDPSYFCKAIDIIAGYCENNGLSLDIRGLTKAQAEALDSNRYKIETERDKSDYIYGADGLSGLAGKKYHSKRNFVSRFRAKYNYVFSGYDPERHRAGILKLYESWVRENAESDIDRSEGPVLLSALDYYEELKLKIGVLTVEGTVVAFSINSADNPLIAHTLIEKADTNFEGSYQAINFFTANEFFKEVKYVNRQEDMGIEGLRKAKLSYHPAMLLEKYKVTRK
jgi:hypothetical protein